MTKKNSRHHARCHALQVLYGLSFAEAGTRDELQKSYLDSPNNSAESASPETQAEGFAWELVEGVWTFREKIDALIERYSKNWRLNRIGHIELTLLRLAIFELFFRHDTPPKVIINEALELSTQFGELQAKKFINGILDSASKDVEKQRAASPVFP